MATKVDVEDGKYTWIIDDHGMISIQRFRQDWVSQEDLAHVPGGKALIALICEAEQTRRNLDSEIIEFANLQRELAQANREISDLKAQISEMD